MHFKFFHRKRQQKEQVPSSHDDNIQNSNLQVSISIHVSLLDSPGELNVNLKVNVNNLLNTLNLIRAQLDEYLPLKSYLERLPNGYVIYHPVYSYVGEMVLDMQGEGIGAVHQTFQNIDDRQAAKDFMRFEEMALLSAGVDFEVRESEQRRRWCCC